MRGTTASLAIGGLALGLATSSAVQAGESVQTAVTAAQPATTLKAVFRPGLQAGSSPSSGGIGTRGPGCPTISLQRYLTPRPGQNPPDLDFDNVSAGQAVTLQQGFIEGEIAAVSFQIPDSEFPIKMELIQAILGSVSTQPTTTRFTIFLWDGEPGSTSPTPPYSASSDSSDPASPPDLILPGGPGGTLAVIGDIQFSVDSMGDPTLDWVIPALGNPAALHTVSIGIRIDQHNTGPGCSPSGTANAFPCTEPATCCTPPSLLTFPNDNWLFVQPCPLGCPQGWKRFSALSAGGCLFGLCTGCRPSGDLALRFKYTSQVCLPPATGTCCAPAGQCSLTTQANCTGAWTQGGVCSPNPCPQPTGVCCNTSTGGCTITTQTGCSGTWNATGSCEPNPCAQPSGACCFSASVCQVLDSATCGGFGGTYIGNNAPCGPSGECPLGACCLPNGNCLTGLSQPQCAAQSGVFQGVGSGCTPNNCPQPTGACCNLSNGFCALLTQANCAGIPGTAWQGPLTVCNPNPCGASGACCTGTACTVGSQGSCAGVYQGNNTACGPAGNPTTCCPANFNQLSGVTVQDIFDFLAAYFQGNPAADFNQIGGVTVQDIFDYLAAYFVGCPG